MTDLWAPDWLYSGFWPAIFSARKSPQQSFLRHDGVLIQSVHGEERLFTDHPLSVCWWESAGESMRCTQLYNKIRFTYILIACSYYSNLLLSFSWILDSDWSMKAFSAKLYLYSRPLLWIRPLAMNVISRNRIEGQFFLKKHEKHYLIFFLKGFIYLVSSHVISGLMYSEPIIMTK